MFDILMQGLILYDFHILYLLIKNKVEHNICLKAFNFNLSKKKVTIQICFRLQLFIMARVL